MPDCYQYDRRLNISEPRGIEGTVAYPALLDIAEQTLLKRLDRVTRFDRRVLPRLDRKSFVHVYEDKSVSLTRRGMEEAVETWDRVLQLDAIPDTERHAELEELVQLGKRWIANYDEPESASDTVGDLTFNQYVKLHDAVTSNTNRLVAGFTLGLAAEIRKLVKLGYLEPTQEDSHFPLSDQMFRLTDKALRLVRENGNPRQMPMR